MSTFSPNAWSQIKGLSLKRLKQALRDDEWTKEPGQKGNRETWINKDRKRSVVLHYHARKTFGPSLLKSLLKDIGWTEDDLERLGLIKPRKKNLTNGK